MRTGQVKGTTAASSKISVRREFQAPLRKGGGEKQRSTSPSVGHRNSVVGVFPGRGPPDAGHGSDLELTTCDDAAESSTNAVSESPIKAMWLLR